MRRNTLLSQLVVAVAVLALAGSQPSYACASPGQREVIFSGLSLPPRLADQPVVAMVAITELLKPSWTSDENWKFTNRVRVVVLAPIRGIDREDEFVIESGVTFCDQWFDDRYMKPALRDRYGWFVAGEFKEGLNGRYFSMNWLSENRH